MKIGDKIQTTLYGEEQALILEDRILADATIGQYESGWWAHTDVPVGVEYFVSDAGVVYAEGDDGCYDVPVGFTKT